MALLHRRLLRPRPTLLAAAAVLLLSPAAMRGTQARTTGNTASPAVATSESWEAQSFRDDPANLKRERPDPRDIDTLLPVDQGRSGVEQMLRRLSTRASLLMIVAHPDDEDGGMLTYVSRGLGARVGMLTLTRGEGGQNVMSGDFDDALGLVRTRELLAADRYLGVDQMFGTEADFGFSKTIEEAFGKWTHERVLYDAVRAVRLYRPLVIASVFIGAVTDGHGQHQVSGEIAQEVFRAAADPRLFPEMGLPPWQAQKVYARVPFATIDQRGMYDYATGKYLPARFHNYVTGASSTTAPQASVTVPEGDTDPLLGGLSYVQFARQGLALQRTQIGSGMRVPPAGRFDVGYTRYGAVSKSAADHEQNFFDHLDTSLGGIAGLAPSLSDEERTLFLHHLQQVGNAVANAQNALAAHKDHAGESSLADGLRAINAAIADIDHLHRLPAGERYDVLHELRVKRAQCNDALVSWMGVSVQAGIVKDGAGSGSFASLTSGHDESIPRVAVPGQRLSAAIEVRNEGDQDFRWSDHTADFARGVDVAPAHAPTPGTDRLSPGGTHTALLELDVKPDAPLSRPFFTRKESEQPFYNVSDPRLRNAPVSPPALVAWETVFYDDLPLTVGAPVKARAQIGQTGTVRQLLTIVPAVSVSMDPRAGVVPEGQKTFPVRVAVAAEGRGSAGGAVRLELPRGWTASPDHAPFLAGGTNGKPVEITFAVTPTQFAKKPVAISAVAEFDGREYREGVALTGYPGLVRDNLYAPATYTVRGVNIHVPDGLRVAFLPGTGDAVSATLGSVGIHPTTVSVADIAAGRLAGFDALLLGVRAYAANKNLASVTTRLLEFAKAGGVVVVQYNSAEYDNDYGPYPYSLTGTAEKVVEEDAPVQLLDPKTQALSWPNRISPDDFTGWVEERGHGFMRSWDPHYIAPTEVHDPGQDPQRGGLLIAPVGQGAYVYCAFALYRQMPAGVPGAYRILVNLLSLRRHPQ